MAFTTSGQEMEWALFLQPRSPHRAFRGRVSNLVNADFPIQGLLRGTVFLIMFKKKAALQPSKDKTVLFAQTVPRSSNIRGFAITVRF